MEYRPEFRLGHFKHKGTLEDVESESDIVTATESIADSDIYNELADDMDGFVKFYEHER